MTQTPQHDPVDEHRLIVAGSGGQGVVTLGELVCMAGLAEDRTVTHLRSYGAEVRGGTANCQVVISSSTIYCPVVEEADSLIILNQLSYDRFIGALKPGGLLLVNSSAVDVDESDCAGARVVALPAAEVAAQMGDIRVANVMLLGAYAELTGLVRAESCRAALQDVLGKRKPELLNLNVRALVRGLELARERSHAADAARETA